MNQTVRNMQGRAGSARGAAPAGGFTLIEMLIAVGALALIAAGVGAIFQATGRTIQAGKRVSAFSQYVNLIKAQMRDDFALMTREGFLVIRNEYADANGNGTVSIFAPGQPNNDDVPLYDGDLRPRLRRIDEIMFFAKGQFVSAREPVDPAFVARADAARIYYGHGQRAVPPAPPGPPPPTDPYLMPDVDDQNTGSPQGAGRLGYYNAGAPVANPNRFASEWILARHVTLLHPPQTSAAVLPNPRPFGLTVQAMTDSEVQAALQPAAASIFRVLAVTFPSSPPLGAVRQSFDGGFDHPQFSSGLVDIASTDLSLIRSIVMTCDKFPLGVAGNFYNAANNNGNDGSNAGPDGKYRRFTDDAQIIDRMQSWMDEGLPTFSMAPSGSANQRTRIRVERAPTNFVGVVSDTSLTALEKAARRADQVMLASSAFLPRCTEFIVEWSFGKQYPSDPTDPNWVQGREGQYIWHGLQRDVNGQQVANFYDSANAFDAFTQSVPRNDPSAAPITQTVTTQLIHGGTSAQSITGPMTSFFGYVDPYFNPDSNNDGDLNDPMDARSPALPWAWPKLIRVTLSLADPNDPSIEQSFQFVFEVPAAQ